jgi:hypothetical protein
VEEVFRTRNTPDRVRRLPGGHEGRLDRSEHPKHAGATCRAARQFFGAPGRFFGAKSIFSAENPFSARSSDFFGIEFFPEILKIDFRP